MSESSCIFCRIVSGDLPADRLMEDDLVVAFRDIDPRAPVHLLIVPRAHVPSLNDVDEAHGELLTHMHRAARTLASLEGVAETGWRLVSNVGGEGGQSVAHLHFHLLGGRELGWPPG